MLHMVFIAISVLEFVCAICTSWMIYSIKMFLKFNMIVFKLVVHQQKKTIAPILIKDSVVALFDISDEQLDTSVTKPFSRAFHRVY
jgi:hypothetical protein